MTEEMQLFCEDMDEQLNIMEDTLMDMSDISIEEVDNEMINRLFRAMHTMKGNAGMFGFDNIVAFAHVAENLLNEVRNEKIALTEEMLDVFLLVNDHSKTLIKLTVNEQSLDEEQLEYHNDILSQLSGFLEIDNTTTTQVNNKKEQDDDTVEVPSYLINIKPKDSFFKSDMDIVSIIKFLDVIGEISHLEIEKSNLPNIEEIDPLKSYIGLSMQYECSEPFEEIQGAFEYVHDDIELNIVNNNTITPQILETDTVASEASGHNTEAVNDKKQPAKKNKKSDSSVAEKTYSLRVNSAKVDELINLISEMVIANATITQIADTDDNIELIEAADTLTSMLEEIRTGVMDIRMVQVGSSFKKLRRIVNDTAKNLGKNIEFVISGEETELDKSVVEKISDPLIHMLRNSIDHGIESVEQRLACGKKEQGRINLRAYPDAGTIVIEIEDDGAGIPKDIILAKAIQNSLVSPSAELSDKEIYNLIFAAGLTTAEEVSDVSGRGVGMDVVKKNIEELKGVIEVDSVLGQGSKITIRLPLTLAIIDGFLVQTGDTKFIIPLEMIQECIELTPAHRSKMKNNDYINLRGSILPLLDASDYFEVERFETDHNNFERENIIIVNSNNQTAGIIVHELHGEFQTVIKPLGEIFEDISWISGATILGDGEVALILDVPMLLKNL